MFAIEWVAVVWATAVVVAAAVEGLARDWHHYNARWTLDYAHTGAVYGAWDLDTGAPLNDLARRIDSAHADLMALIDAAAAERL